MIIEVVGGRSNGGTSEVDGGRSNDGTIEVVGGGGLMREICFVVGCVGSLVSMLDVDVKIGEQAVFVDEDGGVEVMDGGLLLFFIGKILFGFIRCDVELLVLSVSVVEN